MLPNCDSHYFKLMFVSGLNERKYIGWIKLNTVATWVTMHSMHEYFFKCNTWNTIRENVVQHETCCMIYSDWNWNPIDSLYQIFYR